MLLHQSLLNLTRANNEKHYVLNGLPISNIPFFRLDSYVWCIIIGRKANSWLKSRFMSGGTWNGSQNDPWLQLQGESGANWELLTLYFYSTIIIVVNLCRKRPITLLFLLSVCPFWPINNIQWHPYLYSPSLPSSPSAFTRSLPSSPFPFCLCCWSVAAQEIHHFLLLDSRWNFYVKIYLSKLKSFDCWSW